MHSITLIILTIILGETIAIEFIQESNMHWNFVDNNLESEFVELLGLKEVQRSRRNNKFDSLRNSASRFLLEVYEATAEMENEDEADELQRLRRHKRSLHRHEEDHFLTAHDRKEIEQCNNIITFASKSPPQSVVRKGSSSSNNKANNMRLRFNMNDVPHDLELMHATLRLYQRQPTTFTFPALLLRERNLTISVFRRRSAQQYQLIDSVNTTTLHRGWLELNVTSLLTQWLMEKRRTHSNNNNVGNIAILNSLRVEAFLIDANGGEGTIIPISAMGIIDDVSSNRDRLEMQPFIVAYCNGPTLIKKLQNIRLKRIVEQRKRHQRGADYFLRPPPPPLSALYHIPKTCERLNFTLDFKELNMHNWIIAPRKFEAYFCGGECNFPLNSHMNATNHAIVQTLMHLIQPNLPKPCCVPTLLGSISILHYLNKEQDSVNLSRHPQTVARECGCH